MSFNAKDMTQGGQIASMRIRMFSQIANIMLYCLFIFFWILVGLILWVKISWQTFVNGCIYWWCTTLEGMRDLIKSQPVYEIQYYGKTFRMNAAQVLHDKYMIWCGERHCCKVSDEAAFCLIQRPYISKTLLTRRISPRGSP